MVPLSGSDHQRGHGAERLPVAVDFSHDDDFVRTFVGEFTKEHAIDGGEDGDVHANAEGKGQDRPIREPRAPAAVSAPHIEDRIGIRPGCVRCAFAGPHDLPATLTTECHGSALRPHPGGLRQRSRATPTGRGAAPHERSTSSYEPFRWIRENSARRQSIDRTLRGPHGVQTCGLHTKDAACLAPTHRLRIGEPRRHIALPLQPLESDVDRASRQLDASLRTNQLANGNGIAFAAKTEHGEQDELFDFSEEGRIGGVTCHNASKIGIIAENRAERKKFLKGVPKQILAVAVSPEVYYLPMTDM